MPGTSPLSESLGVSMSPLCVLSSAMSPTGILAAGTADGWVWIGTGGEKMSGVSSGTSIQKKRRKCKGLEQDEAFRTDVGHGPSTALYVHYCCTATSELRRQQDIHRASHTFHIYIDRKSHPPRNWWPNCGWNISKVDEDNS
ncbi:hypothetical protein F4604DRAFT_926686 [Suillus subluteus]|nr:hypothetical protein F4604DRAFT_926686 [Suillus subluteus]